MVMKEEERLVVVKRIDEDVDNIKLIDSKLDELELLSKDEKVLRYFQLKKEVNNIQNKQRIF